MTTYHRLRGVLVLNDWHAFAAGCEPRREYLSVRVTDGVVYDGDSARRLSLDDEGNVLRQFMVQVKRDGVIEQRWLRWPELDFRPDEGELEGLALVGVRIPRVSS